MTKEILPRVVTLLPCMADSSYGKTQAAVVRKEKKRKNYAVRRDSREAHG